MNSILWKVVFVGFLTLSLSLVAVADKPHMTNSDHVNPNKKWQWVSRRHKDDRNKMNGSYAMTVNLVDESAGGETKVSGTLKFWTGIDTSGPQPVYTQPHTYLLNTVTVNNGGEDNYKHEYCRWTPAKSTGEPDINVYMSLFKAKGHGNGSSHRRLVVRFKYPYETAAKRKEGGSDCCDDEPDDDVLEEENNPPDPPEGGP